MKNILILMLLISFGGTGAVFFTPGLPEIAKFFSISNGTASLTVTWYLIGYTIAQLLYGPMVHSLGSRNSIIICGVLTLIGSILSILSGLAHSFIGLIIARAIMALGAGGGLKMTITLSSSLYAKENVARVISFLSISLPIMSGLGVFIGGILVHQFGWIGSFYFMVIYSLLIIWVSFLLPEIYAKNERHKFKIIDMLANYKKVFKNPAILSGGLLAGTCSGTSYAFATLTPFIGIQLMGMSPETYGSYSLIPIIGIVCGALAHNYCSRFWTQKQSLKFGLAIEAIGIFLLLILLSFWGQSAIALFTPIILVNFGVAGFIYGNAIALALNTTYDKSNGSAGISFLNMGFSCLLVLVLGTQKIHNVLILPIVYIGLIGLGILWYNILSRFSK